MIPILPPNPATSLDPYITPEKLRQALLRHCKTSRDQLKEIDGIEVEKKLDIPIDNGVKVE